MELRERIKMDFDGSRMASMKVPEWGEEGQPLEVFARPLTLAELQKIQKYAGDDGVLLNVYTVIFKALDAEARPLFTLDDKKLLLTEAEPAVVARLANWIISSSGSAAAAAEK
jgi:hypothetical protein